ncbi:MAG: hypothetical protein J6V77_01570 [Clostridia bacterium]|nr:hypothetical protein [Clostridia bacterium]
MENNKNKKEQFVKGLSYVPFPLLILLILASLAFGIFATVYASVSYIAFESAMIFLIVFGGAILSIGIGLLLVDCLVKYIKKFKGKTEEANKEETPKTQVTTSTGFKLNFQSICYGVMVVGAVFVLISAGLGSISAENWRKETGAYLNQHGYNNVSKLYDLSYHNDVDKIVLDLNGKNVVVIYTDDNYVMIRGYEKFPGQITSSHTGTTLTIRENPSPSIEGDKVAEMLGFLFEENEAEAQIRLFIPSSQKDNIEIVGDYVIAQE